MSLKINSPLVSADWLFANLNDENLIVFDATIAKVTANLEEKLDGKQQIKGAVFFDISNDFSDKNAAYPNTALSPKEFEIKAQQLGVKKTSCIVVYDDLGVYAAPRVWWMFQLMGFTNIAVLNGGFPVWMSKKYPIEKPIEHQLKKGDFSVNYQPEKLKYTEDVFTAINSNNIIIADARSKGRFFATEPEPRSDVKGGHIPNSLSLPFSQLMKNGKLKPKKELSRIFREMNPEEKDFIFTCGSGITASVLALAAETAGYKNHAVYDGSWTEWGLTNNLPINK